MLLKLLHILLLVLKYTKQKIPYRVLFTKIRSATVEELPRLASEGDFVNVSFSALDFNLLKIDLLNGESVFAHLKDKRSEKGEANGKG